MEKRIQAACCHWSSRLPPDQQASNHKRKAGQDKLVDTYAEGLTQLNGGPPNLTGTNTHSYPLLDSHTHMLLL